MKIRGIIALGVLTTVAAFAQDPPSRVARLAWLSGNVSFQPAGVENWTDASLNYPLTTGDHIYTDVGSRAEMRVGANAIRLNGETNVGFLNLDDRTVQARFTEGSLEIRLRRLDDQDLYEVDMPQGAASLLRTGDYRFDTDPGRNATMVTVMSGEVEVSVNGRTYVVHPRQTAYFAEGQEPDIREANPPDEFDRFTADRNLRDDRIPPPVHVSQGMIGYEDLDAYGSWRQTPDYGWAWTPRVVAGWAPYHHGRWAWVEPWGWTWVDEAPWGFAPFHYGRWANYRGEWLWVPGAVVARPVYAPALVVFVGGPRFGASISFGGGFGGGGAVGWFPLGPREAYYPSYHVSNTYVQQVNITHVTNVTVINNVNVTNVRYANQQVPGAVMAVPQQGFASARPVSGMGQVVRPGELAQAQVGMSAGVAPRRESMLGAAGGRAVATPPQSVMARQVVAKSTPPPPPVSFQARQQMLQQNGGRPLAPEQMSQLRQQQPAAVVNRAPVRSYSAPAPMPQNAGPAPAGRQFGQQPNRMDSRPPNARPLPEARPVPELRPVPQARPLPESRPVPEVRSIPEVRPIPEARPVTPTPVRPQPEYRPAPTVRPLPEGVHPQPEVRPAAPVRENPAAREAKKAARREERKEEKKQ